MYRLLCTILKFDLRVHFSEGTDLFGQAFPNKLSISEKLVDI